MANLNGPDASRTITFSASAAASVPASTAEAPFVGGVPAAWYGTSARASADGTRPENATMSTVSGRARTKIIGTPSFAAAVSIGASSNPERMMRS